MSADGDRVLNQPEALQIHQRLLTKDPTASDELAVAYLSVLGGWLQEINPRVAPDLCLEAAEDALLALIRNPGGYSPDRQSLENYLRMSAQGDLRNRLAKEKRHQQGRVSLTSVEVSTEGGKYLGCDDDPSLRLRLEEEREALQDVLPDRTRSGLSPRDRQALDLILQKERRTAVFAEIYGITHLPVKEQQKQVKRHKDRLKKHLARRKRGQGSGVRGQPETSHFHTEP